mmetsp:Transcript_8372/g.17420  ORF Transcript_8372/g.17420 Transcript_8372/m.17420 type:complete len:81 (+) Transcript_8372:378-620(+)
MKTPKNNVMYSRKGWKTNHSIRINPTSRTLNPREMKTTVLFGSWKSEMKRANRIKEATIVAPIREPDMATKAPPQNAPPT